MANRDASGQMDTRQQVNDPAAVSAIFVPVGGGGLIAGIAAYVKWIRPDIKVIGVEPTGTVLPPL
jgi:threonine dehydratase